MTRFASATAVLALSSASLATVTPGTLFGDSYIVKEGAGATAKFYSVLDVYIKGNNAADIISSTFGVTAYTSAFTMNQGDAFVQTNGSTNSAWQPSAGTTGWDSFLTTGNRDQASAASSIGLLLDTNWSAGNGSAISGTAGGPGWYPSVGASTSTNPYARIGYYNGDTSAINTAKAVTFNTTDLSNGVYLGTPTSRIYVDTGGIYNFQTSIQLDSTVATAQEFYLWFRLNGVDVTNSASQMRVQGNNAEIFVALNYFFNLKAGDYVELMFSVSNLGVQLLAAGAVAPHPGIPSIILTVANNIEGIQ